MVGGAERAVRTDVELTLVVSSVSNDLDALRESIRGIAESAFYVGRICPAANLAPAARCSIVRKDILESALD